MMKFSRGAQEQMANPHGESGVKLSCIYLAVILSAVSPLVAASPLTNPFFPFDNGTGRDQHVPLDDQAELVKRTDYAGLGFTGTQHIPEMLQALESRGLKMFTIYVAARIDDEPGYDPGLPEAIRQLQGHGTVIMLTVNGSAPDGDARATSEVREIADMAAASGLRVALYPHIGMYVGRVEDALRVVKNVDRPNVGVAFNLAHFLAAKDEPNLDVRLRDALPHLFMVSINGADHEGGWDRLIQPLDRGEFDVYALLQKLVTLGYHGPIGLQCYQVPGDREENLNRSKAVWRKFIARMAEEK
jgi:sugar phosphate isomerase/epimerase